MSDSPTRSITIRLDAEIFQAVREAAAENSRSMNAEISARLVISLNQDAFPKRSERYWIEDGKLTREPPVPHSERVKRLHQRMDIVMKEWTALSDGLSGLSDVMKGTIIRRLSELEQERSKLDSELRLVDPDYRNNH
ncbi:Arc family DNA-binding protein [Gluconobacter wancherniae]|nr:Arc family DNA-binding protein [Gluconobacter wancherniae]MBF0853326.1 Arc family DNA-binding protein [Gluconobacter wancherniae]GBD55941.1 hypothetical protein NBRC103581_00513 [Gluconobacter wancherniae NBRC 103581]GBR65847.1 hypothetical protein AA103581_2038 [Gluconobacter wancherniae NBRC 103581]